MLGAGCNDLGGTLMEETISRMAGSEHGSAKSVEQLETLVRAAGRTPRQRTTTYAALSDSLENRSPDDVAESHHHSSDAHQSDGHRP